MQLDIHTLVFALGITHTIQIVVFSYQYCINRNYRGIGWWLMWSASEVIGFAFLLLREIPSIKLISIISQNSLIILGVIFLYIGIVRFFDKKENRWVVILIFAVFLTAFLYFFSVNDNMRIRGIIISAAVATVSFMTAYALLFFRPRPVITSANFVAVSFLAHGCFFLLRAIMLFRGDTHSNPFAPTVLNIATYIDALVCSILWTFVLIVMINQRLNAAMAEAKEEMELFFDASPDAAVITRLSDDLIIYVNNGFSVLSGFTRDESIGKTSLEINTWQNQADRRKVTTELRKKGFCDNFESVFLRKDNSQLSGLISARVINLQNVPHVISVTRDISERKRMEEELHTISLTDELTGLYNRRGFIALSEQQLKIVQRTKNNMLLFFADLDKMKQINDTLGHHEGDNALIEVATILKKAFRESDIMGRTGGDEFAVLAMDTTDETGEVLINRLHNTLEAHNKLGNRKYQLSLSIGIANYDPKKPSTLDDLMAQADILMYEQKRNNQD